MLFFCSLLFSFQRIVKDIRDLFFVDECHFDWTCVVPNRAYAPVGERVAATYPTTKKCSMTLIGVYCYKGMIDVGYYTGGVNGARFVQFCKSHLLPHLNNKSIVVMDNLSFHDQCKESVASVGATYAKSPVCSPEFNPIEQSFGQIKNMLRNELQCCLNTSERNEENLVLCIAAAIMHINSTTDHIGQIWNCGYRDYSDMAVHRLSPKVAAIITSGAF